VALAHVGALPGGGELLLEGVAAAGKTDVYLAAIAAVLEEEDGTAIVLVPEVSLVTQLADRIASLVGDQLAVLHSGLSAGERHDTWWRILRGEARVVVGTRMAVFAPLSDLRLIVLDEAHDGAYKSDRTPRYDARWVARRRAALAGSRVVMGTATPDVVTLSRVRGGLVDRARLEERRVGSIPAVEIVDLRAELAEGNRSIFSRALTEALAGLKQGSQQAILLMNRRGASTFILCRDCGESLRCPDCDLPFVYHSAGEGEYLLLPYNLIRKEVASPIRCHGYSLFADGTMAIFRAVAEPTRVHPMQIWRTPFNTVENAAAKDPAATTMVALTVLVAGATLVLPAGERSGDALASLIRADGLAAMYFSSFQPAGRYPPRRFSARPATR